MGLFGSGKRALTDRIAALERQVAEVNDTLERERKRTASLTTEVLELEAISIDAFRNQAAVTTAALSDVMRAAENIRAVISAVIQFKGAYVPAFKRCAELKERLAIVDRELPALVIKFREWEELADEIEQRLSSPQLGNASALFQSVDQLVRDVLHEQDEMESEKRITDKLRQDIAEMLAFRERMEELKQADNNNRSGNQLLGAVALPQPTISPYAVSKGLKEARRVPPSSR